MPRIKIKGDVTLSQLYNVVYIYMYYKPRRSLFRSSRYSDELSCGCVAEWEDVRPEPLGSLELVRERVQRV